MDLTMLQIQNAKEREVDDWKALFHEADSRFKFQGAKQVATSNLAIIEFLWDPWKFTVCTIIVVLSTRWNLDDP